VRDRVSGLGRQLRAFVAIIIGAAILCWLAFKIISGIVHTLVIIAIIAFALYALTWGLGARKSRA
jgi:hypothetical protein